MRKVSARRVHLEQDALQSSGSATNDGSETNTVGNQSFSSGRRSGHEGDSDSSGKHTLPDVFHTSILERPPGMRQTSAKEDTLCSLWAFLMMGCMLDKET